MKKARQRQAQKALPPHHYLTRRLRDEAFEAIMQDVHKTQRPHRRYTSHLLHIHSVEQWLDLLAKTLLRPRGIIVGSITAISIGLILYGLTRYYGLIMPATTLIVLFVAGYAVSCLIELVGFALRRRHKDIYN